MNYTTSKRNRFGAGAVILALSFACVSVIFAQQAKKPSKPRSKAPSAPAKPVLAQVPFKPGETLDYRVLFSKYSVNAAKVETSVVEERDFFGQQSWHFRATAHTIDTMRVLFAIDDEFDSYTSAKNLLSLQFEMYLHEQGKEQTSRYRMTSDGDPAPHDATALRVGPGTRDAIGFLYDLRAVDWQKMPEFRAPVFDGHQLYDAAARVDTPQGTVDGPLGNLSASRVAIRLFQNGKELADTHLWVWLSKDAARTPLQIDAEIPFGTAKLELLHLP